MGFVVTFLVICGIQSSFAASYYVDTAAQFNAKRDKNNNSFSTLYAGDRVYLKGGNWEGLTNTITGSMTDANAQTNPAIIYACDTNYTPTVGGVLITNLSSITLSGTGVVLAGLSFSPTSGMYTASTNNDYNGAGGSIINAATGSRYMTISHIKFDYCGRDNTNAYNQHYGPWIYLYGYHHTMQYCELTGRDFNTNDIKQTNPNLRTSIRDATVVIYKGSSDSVDFGHHDIRYNYFGQRLVPTNSDVNLYIPADGSSQSLMGNGWETIRLGNSSICNFNFATTIEYNSFYRSIYSAYGGANDANGEPEMLSIKSRGNTIRHNTFLNSYGQVCFREADYDIAEGNFFLGGGAYDTNGNIVFTDPLNYRMSGIRVIGYGHIVTGNYFYKIWGSGGLDALCVCEGTNAPGTLTNLSIYTGTVEYKTATYSQILGNSFIDCLSISLDRNLSANQTNLPFATQFQNNLVYYSTSISGALGVNRDSNSYTLAGYGGQASGNYVYSPSAYSSQLGSAASILGTNNNTITTSSSADPLITALFDVIKIPATNSPLLGGGFRLPVIIDTSAQAINYSLASNVAVYASIDNRGLPRPTSGQEIGNYEGLSLGTGTRPLRRYEVGNVTNTYYPLLIPSTNASVTVSSQSQAYSGLAVTPSATTTPIDLPVTYSFGGSSNAPTNAGSYAVIAAVYDPLYYGSTSAVLAISQTTPAISFLNTNQPYAGAALSVLASVVPSGLPVSLTYSNDSYGPTSGAPTNVGYYTVTAVVSATTNTTAATNTTLFQIYTPGAPTAGGGSIGTLTNTAVTLDLLTLAGDGETPSSKLRFTVGSASNGTVTILSDGHTVQFTPSNGYTGSARFNYTVTDTTPPTNLLFNYAFQTNGGTTNGSPVADSSTNSLTGSLVISNTGTANYSFTPFTNLAPQLTNSLAFVLPSTSGASAVSTAVAPSSLNFSNHDWTVTGWFNAAGIATANQNTVFQIGTGSGKSTNALTLFVETNAQLKLNNYYITNNGGNGYSSSTIGGSSSLISTNTWHQFAVVYSNSVLSEYMDAKLIGSISNTPLTLTTNLIKFSGVTKYPERWFNGSLADVAVFTSALGSNQIALLNTLPTAYLGGYTSSNTVVVSVTNTLLPATIVFSNTNQVYDASQKAISFSVSPSNALPVAISYSNSLYPSSTNPPTNAGVFAVSASVLNSNYSGSNSTLLTISPVTPVITISTTNWPYNGSARSVSTAITPTGIPVSVNYAGLSNAPSLAGSYPVLASNTASSNWNASSTTSLMTIYDPVSSWRVSTFGTSNNSGNAADTASPYGIGLNNLQAYTFGVDPSQPVTTPLLSISNSGSNTLTLSFLARAAGSGAGYSGLTRYYNLEATTNLTIASWSPVAGYSNITGSNQVISLSTNTSNGTKFFYRLKAWLQ